MHIIKKSIIQSFIFLLYLIYGSEQHILMCSHHSIKRWQKKPKKRKNLERYEIDNSDSKMKWTRFQVKCNMCVIPPFLLIFRK